MKNYSLTGSLRTDLGKKATRQLRREGKVPCVIYGGEANVNFTVSQGDIRSLIFTPNVYIVDLNIEGKECKAIIKDLQFHPVSDKVLHIDFFQIFEDKPVVMEIPVILHGLAEGVKAGGKLTLEVRKLRVRGLFQNFPDVLDIDVEHLELGNAIQVGDLAFENLELLNSKNAVVAAVKLTRAARAKQATE